jgi:hypothetical protein
VIDALRGLIYKRPFHFHLAQWFCLEDQHEQALALRDLDRRYGDSVSISY